MQVILGKTVGDKITRILDTENNREGELIGAVVGDQHVNGTIVSPDNLVFATLPSLGPQATRGAGQEPAFTLWNLNREGAIPRTYNVHSGRLIIPCFTEYQDVSSSIKHGHRTTARIIDSVNNI